MRILDYFIDLKLCGHEPTTTRLEVPYDIVKILEVNAKDLLKKDLND